MPPLTLSRRLPALPTRRSWGTLCHWLSLSRGPVLLLPLLAALLALPAQAAAPRRDHPLLGTWKIAVPGLRCVETYLFKPDGTTLVTSAKEVSEGEFEVASQPEASGFYRLRDRIVRNNAQPDCMGSVTAPGSEVQRFLRFDPTDQLFLMCDGETLEACIGPFERDEGEAV